MKIAIFASFLLCVLPAFASALEIKRSYNLTLPSYAKLDKKCLRAVKKDVAPAFLGLKGIKVNKPTVLSSETGRDTIVTFAGAEFVSKYGMVEGTVNCTFDGNSTNIVVVCVTFEGNGLAGFKKHILAETLKDPSKQRVLNFSSMASY